MVQRSASRRSQSGQAICMYTVMLMFVLAPMVGLAIDGGRGYLVRLKLSSAVDGGALAAARLMSTGTTAAQQKTYAMQTAVQFVQANFPPGFFGASLATGSLAPYACVDPGVDQSDPCKVNGNSSSMSVNTFRVRTVQIDGHAIMNTLFMGLIGMPTINVNATGMASRRDVRVVLVIDRSGSMSGFFGTSQTSIIPMAKRFVTSFSGSTDFGGRDEMALVVFGGSGIVAYPPRDVANDFTDYTKFAPPDTNFKNATTGIGTATVPGRLDKITSGSHTATAEGLYLAHMTLRADAATNTTIPTKLNVIVLFTDGIPNGITAWANDPTQAATLGRQDYMISKPAVSSCADIASGKGAVPPATNTYPNLLVSDFNTNMIGWFEQNNGNQQSGSNSPNGLYPLMMAFPYNDWSTKGTVKGATNGHGDDIDSYLSDADADDTNYIKQMRSDGCTGVSPMNKNLTIMRSFPQNDLYGNYIDLAGSPPPAVTALDGSLLNMPKGPSNAPLYKSGTLWSTTTQCNKETFSMTDVADGCQVGLASWQAAAHQAWKIWNNIIWDKTTQTNIADPAPNSTDPVIFTIGFTSSADDLPDMNLLELVANDASSPVPFSKRVNGKAYLTTDTAAVDKAFSDIESEILRLSR